MEQGIPEKLNFPQLGKKFPASYRTRRFITAFTTARYLSLSWARSIQSKTPSYFLKTHLNLLQSTPTCLSRSLSLSLSLYSPPRPCTHRPSQPVPNICPHIWFRCIWSPNNIWWGVQIKGLLTTQFYPISGHFLSDIQMFYSAPNSHILEAKCYNRTKQRTKL